MIACFINNNDFINDDIKTLYQNLKQKKIQKRDVIIDQRFQIENVKMKNNVEKNHQRIMFKMMRKI